MCLLLKTSSSWLSPNGLTRTAWTKILGGSGPWGAGGGKTRLWAYAEKSGSGQNSAFTLLNHGDGCTIFTLIMRVNALFKIVPTRLCWQCCKERINVLSIFLYLGFLFSQPRTTKIYITITRFWRHSCISEQPLHHYYHIISHYYSINGCMIIDYNMCDYVLWCRLLPHYSLLFGGANLLLRCKTLLCLTYCHYYPIMHLLLPNKYYHKQDPRSITDVNGLVTWYQLGLLEDMSKVLLIHIDPFIRLQINTEPL
jgi:hypothetical protein